MESTNRDLGCALLWWPELMLLRSRALTKLRNLLTRNRIIRKLLPLRKLFEQSLEKLSKLHFILSIEVQVGDRFYDRKISS